MLYPSKMGTVLEGEKGGRSWGRKKRDGPGRKKRGTVLEGEKRGRSWKEKKGDSPERKNKGPSLLFLYKKIRYNKENFIERRI